MATLQCSVYQLSFFTKAMHPGCLLCHLIQTVHHSEWFLLCLDQQLLSFFSKDFSSLKSGSFCAVWLLCFHFLFACHTPASRAMHSSFVKFACREDLSQCHLFFNVQKQREFSFYDALLFKVPWEIQTQTLNSKQMKPKILPIYPGVSCPLDQSIFVCFNLVFKCDYFRGSCPEKVVNTFFFFRLEPMCMHFVFCLQNTFHCLDNFHCRGNAFMAILHWYLCGVAVH